MQLTATRSFNKAVTALGIALCLTLAGGNAHAATLAAPQAGAPTAAVAVLSDASATNTFPIVKKVDPQVVGTANYVGLTATLSSNGRLDATQRVFTHMKLKGFHGAAMVFVVDGAGNVLWNSEAHTVGVDGTWIPKPDDRTIFWTEYVPADVLSAPGLELKVVPFENPKNMVLENIKWLVKAGTTVADLLKVVKAIY